MDKIIVRLANEKDFVDIKKLEQGFGHESYSDELIIKSLKNSNSINLIAFFGNCAIGYLTATNVFDEGELIKIIVDKSYRRMGCGEILINELIVHLKKNNVCKLFLELRKDNIPAKKLYEKIGFLKLYERREYYNDGMDAEIYWLEL